jgi:hypothetical protein
MLNVLTLSRETESILTLTTHFLHILATDLELIVTEMSKAGKSAVGVSYTSKVHGCN